MFGGKQYYGLVAGLRELTLEGAGFGGGRGLDAGWWEAVREEIMENLSRADRRTVELFYEWDDIARQEDIDKKRALFEDYYAKCASSHSDFLRAWSRFDRNLRNVVAAHTARSRDMPVADALVGSDDIVLSLSRSPAADFSLKGELEYIDALLAAMAGANVVDKERAIDLIRWDKADELSEFDSFGMPTILAYLVKIGIIGRWTALDPAVGREMYDRLVGEMGAELKIEN